MSDKFYITTTLAYINADPHIGFAMEIIKADAMARFKRQESYDVFFNTGIDEHGQKVFQKAQEFKMDVQEYCDEQAKKWMEIKDGLNISFDKFTRTTDINHAKAVQEFWKICEQNGYIYKKFYKIKYCVGCELEKTDSELVNGKCPLHPNRELEIIEEENYFFAFSKFQKPLLDLYKNTEDFVFPPQRLNEIKKFAERGLEDFSISRLKAKMPWGIPVPNDNNQVMYVWFDALVNYISCLGWPCHCERVNKLGAKEGSDLCLCNKDKCNYKKFWPSVQIAGKDNLRQQSAMWQAMLMAAGLPNSKQIFINSFITSNGQKMSKSLGNVINPFEMVKKYGIDGTRYIILSLNSFSEDMDITWKGMDEKFNADLANGIGNIVARVSNMLEKNNIELDLKPDSDKNLVEGFNQAMNSFKTDEAINILWKVLKEDDGYLFKKQPWKLNDKEEIKNILKKVAQDILNVSSLLKPLLPAAADKIFKQFSVKQIKKSESLFPRLV